MVGENKMNSLKENWEAIILIIMIGYDLSLHWADILGIWNLHPLYPYFPLMNLISYDIFWITYWTIAFLLTIKLSIKINKKKK